MNPHEGCAEDMKPIEVSRINSHKQRIYSLFLVISFTIQLGFDFHLIPRSTVFHVVQGAAIILALLFFFWYTAERSHGERMYLQDSYVQIGNDKFLAEDIAHIRISKRNVWIRTRRKPNKRVMVRLTEPDVTHASSVIKGWASTHEVPIRGCR